MDANEKKELERAEKRKKKKEIRDKIQELYEQMEQNQGDKEAQKLELIDLLEEFAKETVWKCLNKSSFANAESFQQVLIEGRIKLLNGKVFNSYKDSLEKDPFNKLAVYVNGAYRNTTKDYIREGNKHRNNCVSENAQMEEDSRENVRIEKEDYKVYMNQESDEDMRSMSEELVSRYMKMVMNSDEEPFQIILLCYSKILPVALGETNCLSADGWAWKKMQGQTMFELSDRFVMVFNSAVKMIQVAFGQPYKDNLELPYEAYEKKGFVVLTDAFEQKNTKNWVTRLNKKIMIALVSAVMREADTDAAVRKLVAESRIYTEFVKKAKRN